MRARQQGRSRDDEIVDEALEVINPPANNREECSAEVARYIRGQRRYAQKPHMPPQGEAKKQLETYLKHLRAAKRSFVRWIPRVSDEFLMQLDAEIEQIRQYYKIYCRSVPHGSKQRDRIAQAAVECALMLLLPGERLRDWARLPLTTGGAWHRLSVLLYEAATGKPDRHHVLNYMRKFKNSPVFPPRLLLGLPPP
jgi:hypothetical protein